MRPKFIVDVNAGKVTKWLRALGCDVLFVNPVDDDDLIAIAHRQGRTIITRDRGIPQRRSVTRRGVGVVLLKSASWREQMRQLITELGLMDSAAPFTRCMECNAPLEERERAWAQGKVPPYVYTTQRLFKECPQCRKVYWRGTHWDRMCEELEMGLSPLPGGSSDPHIASP